jgi:hypothetical protein
MKSKINFPLVPGVNMLHNIVQCLKDVGEKIHQ